MKKFFTLLKIDLINGFALNKNFSKNKKNRKTSKNSNLFLMILIPILLLISSFSYAFMIGNMANNAGKPELLLAYGVGTGALITLMMMFANAYGTLFKSRDFELLASLPIDSKIIVASKIASLTIVGYAYFGMMFVPSVIMYIIYAGATAILIIAAFVVLLFGPLLITSLCSMIAYIFGRIVSRFKNKNTISTILYVFFIIVLVMGIYVINFTIPRDDSQIDAQIAYTDTMYKIFTRVYPVSILAVNAMLGNIIHLLIYVAVMVVPYIIFVIIIGNKYTCINNHARDAYKTSNYDLSREKIAKKQGIVKTLIAKETKTLVSTPVYLTNVIMGPIMSAVIIIVVAYMFTYQASMFLPEGSEMPYSVGVNVVCAISLFLAGMAPASACSISMEGRKFWIIKSLPIDAKKYLWAKLIFSYLLMGPIVLVSSAVAAIMVSANVLDFICILIVPQLASVLYSLVGLLLNLKFYNLEWDNPTQAVKQGANIVLPILIDFGIFAHMAIVLIFGISFMISLTWAMLVFVGMLCLIFGLIVKKHGVNLYNKIAA